MGAGRTRLCVLWCCLFSCAITASATEPRITDVAPSRSDSLLVCRVATAGLPGERIVSTLRSGLTSAVDLRFEVLEENGDAIGGHQISLRLTFDLWEEIYLVDIEGEVARFSELSALRDFLARLPLLPVAALSTLDPAAPTRIRAGLRLHPIAPDTRGLMEDMIAGPSSGHPGDATQEVSISLGRLIKFFYKDDAADLQGVYVSSAFIPRELSRASH